ncbi:MAG: hypothetical protein KJ687_02085, partial [Proteobacteria bacterium]|nr:hypothetical protein [Pseudomonadota bacterium]
FKRFIYDIKMLLLSDLHSNLRITVKRCKSPYAVKGESDWGLGLMQNILCWFLKARSPGDPGN